MALFSPVTGRKHQIRVHAAQVLQRSIVGDFKYGHGVAKKIKRSLPGVFPMMLHCRSVTLKDYFGKELTITAKMGKYFTKCADATGMGKFNTMPWPHIDDRT
jgi:23S rRNA-/tRNA-specific pseudouridylate synthase